MLKFILSILSVFLSVHGNLPVKVPTGNISGPTCPASMQHNKDAAASLIIDAIESDVIPRLNTKYNGLFSNCGGDGWTIFLNLYNSNGIRGCHRRNTGSTDSCMPALLSSNHGQYSRVCGRVVGYSVNDVDGFHNSAIGKNSIDQSYVDGVSITYGHPGSRNHIWTFVAADTTSNKSCSCINSSQSWPYQQIIPSFVGNSYFCDLGRTNGTAVSDAWKY